MDLLFSGLYIESLILYTELTSFPFVSLKFSVLSPSSVYLLGLNCLLLTMTKGYDFLENTFLPSSGIYAEVTFSGEPSLVSSPSATSCGAHSCLTFISNSFTLFVVCPY